MGNEDTLDYAEEAFRENPNRATADNYLQVASEYYADDMIGFDTMKAVIDRLEEYYKGRP